MTHEEAREYVEHWRKAGPALEKIRREELRSLTDERCRSQCHALMELGELDPRKRPTNGLVEQQRIFMKARP